MVASSAHRVKQYRARKSSTPEGHEEIKAKNREYKARWRRKKELERLRTKKSHLACKLSSGQQELVNASVLEYKSCKMKKLESKGKDIQALAMDDQQGVDIAVLRHEIKRMEQVKMTQTALLKEYYIKSVGKMDKKVATKASASLPVEKKMEKITKIDNDKMDKELVTKESPSLPLKKMMMKRKGKDNQALAVNSQQEVDDIPFIYGINEIDKIEVNGEELSHRYYGKDNEQMDTELTLTADADPTLMKMQEEEAELMQEGKMNVVSATEAIPLLLPMIPVMDDPLDMKNISNDTFGVTQDCIGCTSDELLDALDTLVEAQL